MRCLSFVNTTYALLSLHKIALLSGLLIDFMVQKCQLLLITAFFQNRACLWHSTFKELALSKCQLTIMRLFLKMPNSACKCLLVPNLIQFMADYQVAIFL